MVGKIAKRRSLLLGVTGGIATGKSTVADMLSELGSPMIEFDLLTRIVQQPGKPAYKEIVGFFGEQVLQPDGELDRKKISEIVFQDSEKLRRLEEITHPRIHEEYGNQVERCIKENPRAIIQVVIPLLIEKNLQAMFDKLLLVYVPLHDQIKRLMRRDAISQERAESILSTQLSIEEKKKYADYIVDNSRTLDITRQQVVELWEKLTRLQREMVE
jgi:dephospho-CoA kinase